MITLDNRKVHDFIVAKDRLVDEGRKISQQLDGLQKKIEVFEKKERDITAKADVKELKKRGDALNDECQKKFAELEKVVQEMKEARLATIPKEMKDEHLVLLKERENLERERNKIFLKVQKIKDRIVPIIQKEVKPLLKEYDDIETAKTKDGKVVINTFNHLEDFKRKFR
jgi:predicted  nucleic acid-binding Zn-ribbon protein